MPARREFGGPNTDFAFPISPCSPLDPLGVLVRRWTPLGSLFAVGPPWGPCLPLDPLGVLVRRWTPLGSLFAVGPPWGPCLPLDPFGVPVPSKEPFGPATPDPNAEPSFAKASEGRPGTRNRHSGRRPETLQPRPTAWVGRATKSSSFFHHQALKGRKNQGKCFAPTGLTSLSPSPPPGAPRPVARKKPPQDP